MTTFRNFSLQGKRLHRSAGVFAGFASALSVLTGTLAGYAAPTGFRRFTMALHLTHKPFLLRMVPVFTGLAVALATAAGLLGFYLWMTERADEPGPTRHD